MWSGRIIWRSSGKRWCRDVTTHVSWMLEPGLLMRPEHNETQAKTETRECETEIETETKNLLWDRDQKLRDRDQSSQLQVKVTQIGMFHFFYYTHEVNDEPEMDFAFKMISE